MFKKLKQWINEKRADSHFRTAGPAHSLSPAPAPAPAAAAAAAPRPESASSVSRQSSSEGGRPKTEAERRAAEAAVQRLANRGQPPRAAAPAKPVAAPPAAAPASASKEQGASKASEAADRPQNTTALLQLQSVKFVCPLCETILAGAAVKDHLAACLEGNMAEDPITASSALIFSLSPEKEALAACVEVLGKYFHNIIEHPDEQKYRKIRKGNAHFKDKVLPIYGAAQLLHAIGFVEQTEGEENFLVLSGPYASFEEKLLSAVSMLADASTIVPDLYRDPQVFKLGSSSVPQFEVPADFYELTVDEMKQLHALRRDEVETALQLRTQAMREAQAARRRRRYLFAVVRVRFSDRFVLQGTFHANSSVSDLYDFVRQHLRDPTQEFQLVLHPERTVLDPSILFPAASLVPAAIVNFSSTSTCIPFLNDDTLKDARPL